MPTRRCLGCGQLTTDGSRCKACELKRNAAYEASPARRNYKKQRYGGTWQAKSKAIRQAWVQRHGWVCPGWQRLPHASSDLVVDHDVGVLCRTCNAKKAATADKARGITTTPHPHSAA